MHITAAVRLTGYWARSLCHRVDTAAMAPLVRRNMRPKASVAVGEVTCRLTSLPSKTTLDMSDWLHCTERVWSQYAPSQNLQE